MPEKEKVVTYSLEQIAEIARVHSLLEGTFEYLHRDPMLTEERRARAIAIVQEIRGIHTEEELFAYQDLHLEESDYLFLTMVHPGLNVNGWAVLLAGIDPMKYGTKIERSTGAIHGTITQRSAKS